MVSFAFEPCPRVCLDSWHGAKKAEFSNRGSLKMARIGAHWIKLAQFQGVLHVLRDRVYPHGFG